MAPVQITLKIEKVEVQTRSAFGPRYAWQTGEEYAVTLNVVGYSEELDQMVYFNSPAMEMCVTSGGPVAVVTYGKETDWLTSPENYVVRANDSTPHGSPQPKVQVGQTISVKGSIKKQYRTGIALNRVKLVGVEEVVAV